MRFYGKFPNADLDRDFLLAANKRFRKMFDDVYSDDNVILFNRTLGFKRDSKLMRASEDNVQHEQEHSLLLRINVLLWSAKRALAVEGDFVECGVFRGFCASVIADYLDFAGLDREFFLYDTFEGIPPESDSEGHDRPVLRHPGLYEAVVERFAKYPNVRLVKGLVPHSFELASPPRIAFLHVDMNSSKSEIAALDGLFDRVAKGGIVLFDDYGWTGYEAQQLAEQTWMKERGQNILELPSGHALVVKV